MGMTTYAGRAASHSGRLRIALLAGSMLAVSAPHALAQSTAPARIAQQSVSIPAGPLTTALNRLAAQTGIEILFDAALTSGRTTAGISGTLTPSQALDALLAGSGITARFAGSNQVVLTGNPSLSAENPPYGGAISLDAITVYGAKDTNTLQNVSASVGIVRAEEIEDSQIRYMSESFRMLGNVMDSATLNAGFVIRGMSSEGFVPAGAPAGSLYVDGILQSRYNARFGTRSLWDAEQVEVYRGPQSTLSGRAAMVGAIYLKTKDPTFSKEVELSGTLGTNNLFGSAFVVNTPLVGDQAALRISGSVERAKTDISYPSYVNFAGYDDLTTEISQNIRAKLLLTPSSMPDTRALLSYSFSNDRPNERLIGIGPGFDLSDGRGDFYDPVTYAEFRAVKVHNAGLEITHNFSDTLRLTSMTGFQYGETTRRSVDADTPGVDNGIWGTVGDTLFTQEVRLNYEGDRWKWVAGLFGSYQKFDSDFDAVAYSYYVWDQIQTRKTTNLAAFGEATYEFMPSWFVTMGGRIDYLREQTVEDNGEGVVGSPLPIISNQADFNELNFVPKLGLSKTFGDNHTVGATYTQGFRTGGFYVNYVTFEPEYYGPEKANNYELFYKGSFLDNRLTINANLFYTTYDDQQVEIRPDPLRPSYRITTNAANSQSWGFEFEPTYQVNKKLALFASVGYLNTRFITFDHAQYGDLAGEAFPEAPEWTIGFGGRYVFDNGIYVGADAKYVAGYTARFGVPPLDYMDSRFIVNAQAGYKAQHWEVAVFAENLFDERYLTVVDYDALPVYGQLGASRSVGLNMKAKF
ncbi:TonB-dependent receptor domain-containing protein [Xanthobacteraceae bacterium A53D]